MKKEIVDKVRIGITIVVLIVIIIGAIFYVVGNFNKSFADEVELEDIVEENEIVNESKLENENKIIIHITGHVNTNGIIELDEGARINDAIEKAGGLTEDADTSKINLAYKLSDGEKVYIPGVSDETEEVESASQTSTQNKKVNINTATSEELQEINGVGQTIAQRIIDYRNKNGKFSSVEELKNVSGIGDSKFEKIKDYVVVK